MKLTKPCVYAAAIFSLLASIVPGQARDFDPPLVFGNDHLKVEINQILNQEEASAKKAFNKSQETRAASLGKRFVLVDITVTMYLEPIDNNNVYVGQDLFQAVDDEGYVSAFEVVMSGGIKADLTVGRKVRGDVMFMIDKDRELAEIEFKPELKDATTKKSVILTGRIPPEDK